MQVRSCLGYLDGNSVLVDRENSIGITVIWIDVGWDYRILEPDHVYMDYEDSVWITAFSLNDTNSDRRQKASSPFVNPQSNELRFRVT